MKSAASDAKPVSTNTGCAEWSTNELMGMNPTPGASNTPGNTATSSPAAAADGSSSVSPPCPAIRSDRLVEARLEGERLASVPRRVERRLTQRASHLCHQRISSNQLAPPHRDADGAAQAVRRAEHLRG